MRAIWFGREWMARSLVEGQQFVFSGKVNEFNGQIGMNGPEFEPYDSEELLHTGRLVPVYPLTEGLTKRVVRRIVKAASDSFADLVEDALPDSIRARAQLLGCRKRYARSISRKAGAYWSRPAAAWPSTSSS